jgi:hypothetical protein
MARTGSVGGSWEAVALGADREEKWEKGGEVGSQRLLFSGPVARARRKKGAGGPRCGAAWSRKRGRQRGPGCSDVDRHDTDAAAPGYSNGDGRRTPHGHGCNRGGRRGRERRGWLTGGAGRRRGPVAAAGCGRERERAGQRGMGC